jgi:formylmethanofuran dehydrogenase subunit E
MGDERDYRVCDLCGEVMPLEDAFAYLEERMLVCRSCTTATFWSDLSDTSLRESDR